MDESSADDRYRDAQERMERRRREQSYRTPRLGPVPGDTLAGVLQRAAEVLASDEEVAAYEADRERERRTERLYDAGALEVLTPAMRAAVASDRLASTEALDLVRRWVAYQRGSRANGSRPVLALIGKMGRGKTVAAAWLLAHEGGRYVEAEELCRLQGARWGEDRDAYRRVLRSGVLVVDEVGTEEDPRRAAAALHDVVNQRQGRTLTLLLGNLSRTVLRERLDPRTWDRMRECATVVELDGESLRRGEA